MRRTSVMIEFSDEVYDLVVEPMKKQKTFSKLVASLVEGYLEDGYIRAYAEDTLEEMRRASVSSFSASIDSMAESLSNMGLFTDELNSASLTGKTKFKEKAEQQAKAMQKEGIPVSNEKENVSSVEIDKINKRIDDMQSSINTTLSEMFAYIKGNMNVSNTVGVQAVEPVIQEVKPIIQEDKHISQNIETEPKVVEKHNKEENLPLKDEDIFEDVFEEVAPEEAEEDTSLFVSSLLDGNSFAF